ncbi:WecB/TagA/CpsF family glycosyltransferase [Mucilaginibacter boryungensis]|uniref:WecB/TagA/CpsF family glycosyltransferase n=2 Tax=Mucilaginibacter boryungensis TaxID=768480 RepID=A0ABR9XHT9_9SPHI|nr:WecB/TagA/CpsF family glycosyltransferase [Mucilaginibacter boryungensis]
MFTSTCSCLGYDVFADTLEKLPTHHKTVINTINQYSYCMAERDGDFKDALKNSDILLPDGIGITIAAKFLKGSVIKKVSGADLHDYLLKDLNDKGGSCFYLGSSTATLEKIEKRLKKEYPNIKGYFYSPPFKKEFTREENQEMIDRVNEVSPDVLFIGMTAPKQEKWAIANKSLLNAKYICSIGAVFDFYAGTVKRPNKVWINLGLEWLGRMVSEPRRLYKRYLVYGPVFAYKLIQQKLKTGNTISNSNSRPDAPVITIPSSLRNDEYTAA